MPTKQETFDTVAKHLLTQNAKAENTDEYGSLCAYRAADGKRCAAGCLIPDELYSEDMEKHYVAINFGPSEGQPTPPGKVIVELGHDLELVHALQKIHDRTVDVSTWRDQLRRLATSLGLSTEVLDNA